jgi:hypothetical protein
MTSLQSHIKQIPAEAAYFRPVPSLSLVAVTSTIMAFTPGAGAPLRTVNASGVGANGSFAVASWTPAFNTQLSTGACLLKDMGRTIVSAGRTFRRVQMVVSDAAFSTTGGVGGGAAGVDADYLCGYIELGLNGNGVPAPFVRA